MKRTASTWRNWCLLGTATIVGGLAGISPAQELNPETPGLNRIVDQIKQLESNRDPKCVATAIRLENFMYGTPLTSEARLRKTELQKSLIRKLWAEADAAARKAGATEIGVGTMKSAIDAVGDFDRQKDAGYRLAFAGGKTVTCSERDVDHYSSIAYALRAILAVQQENLLLEKEQWLPLNEAAIQELKKALDLLTLATLQLTDRESRLEDEREISAERFEKAWRRLAGDIETPPAVPPNLTDKRQGMERFQVFASTVSQKVASYEAYNDITQQVFLRNLQVYYAKKPWPKDPQEANAFRSAFTESAIYFSRSLLRQASQRAAGAGHPLIRLDDAEGAVQDFTPHRLNEFEDVIFFPKLPRDERVTLESYDCDSFRDSGLHWKYLEAALSDELKAGAPLLEPDPFAAEMLVEGIAQFSVLVLRMAGTAAEDAGAETLATAHLQTAFDAIQSRADRNREIANEAEDGSLISSDQKQPETGSGETFFAETTKTAGIDFHHRSADWLSRLLRSYLKTGEDTGTLTIPPAFGGAGVAVEDVNEDGNDDILLLGGVGNRLYFGDGKGGFRDGTVEAGLGWKRPDGTYGEPRQPIIADLDNDGLQDIVIVYVDDNHRVYRNLGGGKFEDVTEDSGLGGKGLVGGPATVCDFDNDGLLDIYIGYFGNYLEGALPNLSRHNTNALPNKLFRNVGGLKFEDITAGSGADNTGWSQAVGHSDFDRDGWQDLIVGNDFGVNSYYRNRGDGTFEEVNAKLGTDKPSFTMNVGIADLNRDLFPDFYISNIVTMVKDDKYVLPNKDTRMYFNSESLGRMRVVEANDLFVSAAPEGQLDHYVLSDKVGRGFTSTGWSWDADFFDFDLDGDEDLYCLNGMNEYAVYSDTPYYSDTSEGKQEIVLPVSQVETNVFFLNEDGKLGNANERSGLDFTANSRSAAYFDYDGDGDLDIVVNNYHAPARLFRNDAPDPNNHWLKIRLTGDPEKGSNRDAIGAKLVVRAENGLQVWREVHGTIGYLSVHPKTQHFGLGVAEAVSLEVTWPNGDVEKHEGLKAGQRYEIAQGKGLVSP